MRVLQLVRMAFLPGVHVFHPLVMASLPRITAFPLQMVVLSQVVEYMEFTWSPVVFQLMR
jgi:hypothetical protein